MLSIYDYIVKFPGLLLDLRLTLPALSRALIGPRLIGRTERRSRFRMLSLQRAHQALTPSDCVLKAGEWSLTRLLRRPAQDRARRIHSGKAPHHRSIQETPR